jgi:hypothetical protein
VIVKRIFRYICGMHSICNVSRIHRYVHSGIDLFVSSFLCTS